MGPIIVGVKVGQRMEPTALAVAEQGQRVEDGWVVETYTVRFLERLPAGTSYPAVSKRLGEVVGRLASLADAGGAGAALTLAIYADVTGLGAPVVRVLQEANVNVIPVFFTHGDRRVVHPDDGTVTLGKALLVSQVQALLQTGRLHLPRTPEAETLAKELIDYQIDSAQVDNDRYGAFVVGTQDDLVTALGLVTQGFPEVTTEEIVYLEDIIGDHRIHIGGDAPYQTPHQQVLADWRRAFDNRY